MPTAHLHIDNLGGHGDLARCYKLDGPRTFGRRDHEYVVISVRRPWTHIESEVQLYPSTDTGATAEGSVKKYPGSFVAHGDPFTDEAHLEGCFTLALGILGYEIVAAPEPEPEPEPAPVFPEGLDYDPDEIPDV